MVGDASAAGALKLVVGAGADAAHFIAAVSTVIVYTHAGTPIKRSAPPSPTHTKYHGWQIFTWITMPLHADASPVGAAELGEGLTGGEGWKRLFQRYTSNTIPVQAQQILAPWWNYWSYEELNYQTNTIIVLHLTSLKSCDLLVGLQKNQGITNVIRIHYLGTVDICTKCQGSAFNGQRTSRPKSQTITIKIHPLIRIILSENPNPDQPTFALLEPLPLAINMHIVIKPTQVRSLGAKAL